MKLYGRTFRKKLDHECGSGVSLADNQLVHAAGRSGIKERFLLEERYLPMTEHHLRRRLGLILTHGTL